MRKDPVIADLSKEELQRRHQTIQPLAEIGGKLHYITNGKDVSSSDFFTSPQIGEEVTEQLDTVAYALEFRTTHANIDENIFEPTIEEILRQIPEDILNRVSAFCVEGKIKCVSHGHGFDQPPTQVRWKGKVCLYGPSRIPDISYDNLQQLVKSIQPLVRKGTELFRIQLPDLRRMAFTWDPEVTTPAENLEEVATITTYHRYGFHGFFKPSIAEVLAQIPAELVAKVSYFEVQGPQTVHDLNAHKQELNEGYHVAETILYR